MAIFNFRFQTKKMTNMGKRKEKTKGKEKNEVRKNF